MLLEPSWRHPSSKKLDPPAESKVLSGIM
jgi:hypothetical protein